ncbi:chaperone for protein-folding within the ER, fungal-domain-containing protein [Hygrophoropsis aurantiaca]|uniref:Chaperone for protein-folding within the ER, fungal-domain-containing protein n=1 Tax=Hygrophoropsis aurantiaca TaxID=72124 RepID=A0ACB8AIR9_9AGAM|nr:chaperone for protein-folding within the ER, fungal-domain-containing protein [Hygrophoropsis aurantiaca]
MILAYLLPLVLALPSLAQPNITAITGTWSSGSQNVLTGPGFAQPANESFTYPPTTGLAYSFTADGYYEIARYRMTSNGTQPNCITGVMNWCHGTYDILSNGSIIMTPFGDGYQQIQDPCAATSNFIENYNDTEYYPLWTTYQDVVKGYTLQLYQYDGTPLAPAYQVTVSPIMLPTQPLRNVTPASVAAGGTRIALTGKADRTWSPASLTMVMTVITGLGMASVLL